MDRFQGSSDLFAVTKRAIDREERQFLGVYLTDDGEFDVYLTAIQHERKLTAGPLPADIAQCGSCGTDIVWVKTKANKNIPVNVVVTDKQFRPPSPGELKFIFGTHQSHFQTCPNADDHRHG